MNSQVRPLKILLHDYSGHAFTAQLARQFAKLGNQVVYVSFAGFASPKGRVGAGLSDPPGFKAVELDLDTRFDKENLFRRGWQQRQYVRRVKALALEERPDAVISANAPLEVQRALLESCNALGGRFVFWLQDIHSEAIKLILSRKNRLLGRMAGLYYRRIETRTLRESHAVVAIAEAFRDMLSEWGIDTGRVSVIENWAAINDIPLKPSDNDWVKVNMPGSRPRVVYSGTLARKHNPDVILHLARNLDADFYVFSEGKAPNHIREAAAAEGLDNVFVRKWVPVEHFPDMLAGADILFVMIEQEAAVFSVPSKILSYLAAGRPILASIPEDNLASRTIRSAGAGLVSSPNDLEGLVADARRLLADGRLCRQLGESGRKHAERKFDIEAIALRFLDILTKAGPWRDEESSVVVPPVRDRIA